MDTIIRNYWICWDNSDGTEGEYLTRSATDAWNHYRKLAVPYKKIEALYNDHDATLATEKVTQLPSGYWAAWRDGDWIDAALPDERSAIARLMMA